MKSFDSSESHSTNSRLAFSVKHYLIKKPSGKFFVDEKGGLWCDTDPHGVDMSGKRRIMALNEDYEAIETDEGCVCNVCRQAFMPTVEKPEGCLMWSEGFRAAKCPVLKRFFCPCCFKEPCECEGDD
jgi:hypothetical protein